MAANEIHKGDIGTQFKVTVKNQAGTVVDLSGMTTKQILFKKPSGTILTKTASFLTDGSDGILVYVTVEGDISEAGEWFLQAYYTDGTSARYTDITLFTVHRNLN